MRLDAASDFVPHDTDAEAHAVQMEIYRRLADAAGVVRMSGASLDVGYIERWAAELGVLDLWKRVAISPG